MAVQIMCNKDDPGAYPVKGYPDVYLREIYKGSVVWLRERNMYDDSDFFACVWDADRQEAIEIMYGTTRGWTCGSAEVDASPEVKALASAYLQAQADKAFAEKRAREIWVGDPVKVTLKAGKNKARSGSIGRVFWTGQNPFNKYRPEMRYGVEFDDGARIFFSQGNVTKEAA